MNQDYEDLITFINWQNNTDATDAVKLRLMQNYSKTFLESMREYSSGLYHRLQMAMNTHEEEFPEAYDCIWSDDGLHDCLCHIVGLGEEAVEEVVEYPGLIAGRYRENDYEENFWYVFPSDWDWKLLKADYYKEKAKEIRGYIESTPLEGMDEMDLLELADEIELCEFDASREYDEMYRLSRELGQHALVANVYSDGVKFYGKG